MLEAVRRVAEGLGDLVTEVAYTDGPEPVARGLLIDRGSWSLLATDRGSYVAIGLRMTVPTRADHLMAGLSPAQWHAFVRLVENVSCQGRTASLLDIETHRQALKAIVLEQRVFEPDGSAAMNQRIADAIQELVITAVRVRAALARVLDLPPTPPRGRPQSEPGEMFG